MKQLRISGKTGIFLLMAMLLLINIYIFLSYNSLKKKYYTQNQTITYTNDFSRMILANRTNYSLLDPDLQIVTVDGDTTRISDVILSESLVFKYSVTNCGDCVDAELKLISQKTMRGTVIPIILLA